WETLRSLSGGLVGACAVRMRPCLSAPCPACCGWWDSWRPGFGWMNPVLLDGRWINCPCGQKPTCSCEPLCEIAFPGPVAMIQRIILDGAPLDTTTYRVDNHRILVREDGGCWPSCQDLGAEPGEPGTLVIDYVPGIVPDAAG